MALEPPAWPKATLWTSLRVCPATVCSQTGGSSCLPEALLLTPMTLLQSLHLGPCLSGPLGSCKHAADLDPSPRAGRLVAVGQLQLHFIILGGLGMQAPKAHRGKH